MRFVRIGLATLAVAAAVPVQAHADIIFYNTDWVDSEFGTSGFKIELAEVLAFGGPGILRATYDFVSPTLLAASPGPDISYYSFAPATLTMLLSYTTPNGLVTTGTFSTTMCGPMDFFVNEEFPSQEGRHAFQNIGCGPGEFSQGIAKALHISRYAPYTSASLPLEQIVDLYTEPIRHGNTGMEIFITTAVPEPATLTLLGLWLGTAGYRYRRRLRP